MLSTKQAKLIKQCREECGQTAVNLDFSKQAGLDLYDGQVADDCEGWDEKQFICWTQKMEERYCRDGKTRESLMGLYQVISSIMGDYAERLKN